jgi:hypothetical protein
VHKEDPNLLKLSIACARVSCLPFNLDALVLHQQRFMSMTA